LYADVEVLPVSPRLSAGVLIRACRPRQWAKNLLVLAAPCAAGVIDRPLVAAQVAGAFVVLCLLSSATYLVNDVRDVEQDRQHPRKRLRPIAAGELSPRVALRCAAVLALAGIALATAIAPGLGAVGLCYLALTASYSLWLRRVVVLDILAIAAGFVLRAVAGGVATDIYLSRWFVIVTGCCAIFLVAAKRYAELREHSGSGPARATLRRYSLGHLRLTLMASATIAGVAYTGWAFTRPSHLLWYGLSIAPFLLWLARYASLIGSGAGQAPEELILHDRVLLALGVTWGVLFLGGVYVSS
jgi:decaprenyl-phosphate phosphoribosyltransferase